MTITSNRAVANEVQELKDQIRILELQLEGNIPEATFWLQRKVHAQRAALDRLNHKIVSQRFVLRTLEEKGRGLTREEYIFAREHEPKILQDRIEKLD